MRLTRAIRERIYDVTTQPGTPDADLVMDWWERGVSGSLDGCITAARGACKHGEPAWLVELGLVEDDPKAHALDVVAIVDRLNQGNLAVENLDEFDAATTATLPGTAVALVDGSILDYDRRERCWVLVDDED